LASITASTGVEPKFDRPNAVPRAADARAMPISASGCTICTPVGEISTGIDSDWPMTWVLWSRSAGLSATVGTKPSWRKARSLSTRVSPASEPALRAPATEDGRIFSARWRAISTLSNHLWAIGAPRTGRGGDHGGMVEAHAEKRLGGRTWPEIDASEPTVRHFGSVLL
jgi:hypothetical protein